MKIALRILMSAALVMCSLLARADEPKWPLVFSDDFENGADHWRPFDQDVWRIDETKDGHVYSQFQNKTKYNPPHRSPFLISLLDDVVVSDFDLRVRVKSTFEDYDHRDACVVFGYKDPTHFYYVHFGKKTDDHANQVFVVDDAPRIKISTETTPGTAWNDEWHNLRILRRTEEGSIEVYFDDLEHPVMTATDKRFEIGQIGIGSFDDTTQWDKLELYGVKQEKKRK